MVLGGALAAAALVAAGVGVGAALDDDPTIEVLAPADTGIISTQSNAQEPTATPATPEPTPEATEAPPAESTTQTTPGGEPVATAAARVAGAVVNIQVSNFGEGSGIIYSAEGHLITNAHVVGGATEVTVTLANGTRVEGDVLGADTGTDVAVVKIDPSAQFAVAEFAGTETVQVGQTAIAIGSPFGLEGTVTAGIVSAINRIVPNDLSGIPTNVAMIQTDAPINPGNSGGALVDQQGRVIGMNTSIRTDGGQGNLGVGFAIPADTAELVAERIVNGEPLESGYLGVSLTDAVLGEPGAQITEIVPGDPADEAGLAVGDTVRSVNGQQITSSGELAAAIQLETPGSTITVVVEREGETIEIDVVLGALTGQ